MFFVLISSEIRPMDISTTCLSVCHSLPYWNDIESVCSKICTCQIRWVYGRISSSKGFDYRNDSNPRYPKMNPKKSAVSPCYMSPSWCKASSFWQSVDRQIMITSYSLLSVIFITFATKRYFYDEPTYCHSYLVGGCRASLHHVFGDVCNHIAPYLQDVQHRRGWTEQSSYLYVAEESGGL